jgi:hypothetical protein
MNRILAALLLCSVFAGSAAAQDAQRRIDLARRQAGAAGLPVSVLDDKIAEGRAKNVPLDRIAAAVEHRLSGLSRARDVMGRGVAGQDLAAGADALDAGVSATALATLSQQSPPAERAVAVAVLSQLVRDGMASERALAQVQAALRHGPDALRELPAQATAVHGHAGTPHQSQGHGAAASGSHGGGPPASVPGPRGHGHGNPNP